MYNVCLLHQACASFGIPWNLHQYLNDQELEEAKQRLKVRTLDLSEDKAQYSRLEADARNAEADLLELQVSGRCIIYDEVFQ